MKSVFLIRLGSKLFEPIRKNSSKYIVTHEDITCIDVVELNGLHLHFSEYIIEEGTPVGVRLWCDYGHGYGFNNGTGIIEMRPGDTANFSYDGTSIDGEGDPEDFSIDYYLELLEYDDKLI